MMDDQGEEKRHLDNEVCLMSIAQNARLSMIEMHCLIIIDAGQEGWQREKRWNYFR